MGISKIIYQNIFTVAKRLRKTESLRRLYSYTVHLWNEERKEEGRDTDE